MISGLAKRGYEGLDKPRFEGLSIVILRPLTPNRQIVISLYRFVDNWGIGGYKGLVTMKARIVNHYRAGEVKEIPNTPIDKQTISSGYKGLDNMLDKRFEGNKGLKGLDMKVWGFFIFNAAQ